MAARLVAEGRLGSRAEPSTASSAGSSTTSFRSRDDDGWFVERMTVRLASTAPINDPATPFRPVVKVALRGIRRRRREGRRPSGLRSRAALLEAWYPLEILHFPLRSREQWRASTGRRGPAGSATCAATWRAPGSARRKAGGRDVGATRARGRVAVRTGSTPGRSSPTCAARRVSSARGPETRDRRRPRRSSSDGDAVGAAVFAEAEVVRRHAGSTRSQRRVHAASRRRRA